MGVLPAPIMGLMSFGSIIVNALLFVLDWLVRELEYYLVVSQAESLCEELDYLNHAAFLEEIRQSPEYRNLC